MKTTYQCEFCIRSYETVDEALECETNCKLLVDDFLITQVILDSCGEVDSVVIMNKVTGEKHTLNVP